MADGPAAFPGDPASEISDPDLPPPPLLGVTGDSIHEPKHRPWELELLISGAVVFALLQLPSEVTRLFESVDATLSPGMGMLAFLLYYYAKLILYTLISSFIVHLCARAYWVGLIGLEAVFPVGIRWEDKQYGPITRETYEERMPRLQTLIDRADRFCSVIFSFAFSIVFIFAYSIFIGGVASGIAWLISQAFFGGTHWVGITMALILPFSLMPFTLNVLDRTAGRKWAPESRKRRLLKRMLVMQYYMQIMPAYGPVFSTLFTNINKKAIYPVFLVLLMGLFGYFIVVDVMFRRGLVAADGYAFLPDVAGAAGVVPSSYENLTPRDDPFMNRPTIQADIIRDPYVKLFVPYLPRRHNPAMTERCPGVEPLGGEGVRLEEIAQPPADSAKMAAVLDCWARLQPVTLDGRVITPTFRFYTHPVTGVRGKIAYLPATPLASGEHRLTIAQTPRGTDTPELAAKRAANPYVILFWR